MSGTRHLMRRARHFSFLHSLRSPCVVPSTEKNFTLTKEAKKSTKDKALSQLESKGLKDLFDKL